MKPTIINVAVPDASYEVVVGAGIIEDTGRLVRLVSDARKVAVVTDSNVCDLFGIVVESKLIEAGYDVHPMTVPAGEGSKNWATAGELLEALAEVGLDRRDLVVALGGGVVGDLAGFVSATYLRGIPFVQVPTTLLAQVDSSVGGKTGVDLRAGKNLAGAFKQPLLVIADTAVLGLLPEREWASGLAEIAKSAAIDGEEFLGWLEGAAGALVKREDDAVREAVSRCIRFKAGVVAADERESGDRECLNYGHTLGHAIERVVGYGVVSHGAAVAEGMRFAARLGVEVVGAPRSFVRRQDALLDALGLPSMDAQLDPVRMLDTMRGDKKARSGKLRWVLPKGPGEWSCVPVEEAVIMEHLVAWSASKGRDER